VDTKKATSNGRVVRSAADRQEILRRFEASGRSGAAFCRAEGISRSTFDLWRRKLQSKPSSKKPSRKTSRKKSREFVEVTQVSAAASGGWTLEIELSDGRLARLRC
jgi:transposase-like protein